MCRKVAQMGHKGGGWRANIPLVRDRLGHKKEADPF